MRCEHKDRSVERLKPYGLKYARTRRCHAQATVTCETKPGYFDSKQVKRLCQEHADALLTNNRGWELFGALNRRAGAALVAGGEAIRVRIVY